MRPQTVYRIERLGDRWVVIAGEEPLVVTETEADAARLAQMAVKSLMPRRGPQLTGLAPAERRSFVDTETHDRFGGAFGFPVADVKDGN